MNKTTATHNTPDIYQALVDQLMKDHPDYWTRTQKENENKKMTRPHVPRAFVYVKTSNSVKEVISSTRHTAIIKLYFMLAREKVIRGEVLQLGQRLGKIRARRLTRYHGRKYIDWNQTKKQKKITDPVTGKIKYEKIIYFTSDTYCRVVWKKLGQIMNESLYTFVPSKGNRAGKGFKGQFSTALKENALLANKFEQQTRDINI